MHKRTAGIERLGRCRNEDAVPNWWKQLRPYGSDDRVGHKKAIFFSPLSRVRVYPAYRTMRNELPHSFVKIVNDDLRDDLDPADPYRN